MAYEPIVQELSNKMDELPELKHAFQSSLDLAMRAVDVYEVRGIKTLNQYIKYMSDFVRWVPTENEGGTEVYIHICMFYFVLDLPPVRDWQNAVLPSDGHPRWFSGWIIKYAKTMGQWMDKPESLTPASLATFKKSPAYHMQDYIVPDGGWQTFNEFFARQINPEVRPIDSPADDHVIVSPADCTFDGEWPVDAKNASISAKGIEWPISLLLKEDTDSELGDKFAGGRFTHSFLGPSDYHRLHAPVSGTVVEAKVIPGLCFLEVILKKDAVNGKLKLGMRRFIADDKDIPEEERSVPFETVFDVADRALPPLPPLPRMPDGGPYAPNSAGYQFIQARGLVLIDNPVLGLVAVLPIGMAQVSSVKLSVKKDDRLKKGQEIGYFQMGGSDIVMVFQKRANVKFNQEIAKKYNVGSGVATGGSA